MKKQNLLLPLLATLIVASTAHAQVVYQFSADDGAPTAQGFTQSGSGSVTPSSTTYLNETAWRVEDADTDNTGYQYTHTLSATEVTTLQSRGYRVSARVAFLDTGYNGEESCTFSFADGTRRFLVWIDQTATGHLLLILQTNGDAIYRDLGSDAANDFYNIDIDVAPGGATASLLVNGEVIYEGWAGQANSSQFLRFGNGSTAGRGAGAWNRLQIASRVPESDMTFLYHSGSDSYELDAVNDVAGHLHIPDTFNDGINGVKNVTVIGTEACSPFRNPHLNLISLRFPTNLKTIGSCFLFL